MHQAPEESSRQNQAPTFGSIGSWTAARGQHAPPHRHGAWKITYYRTGRIDSVVDGVRHDVTTGDVLVLPPRAVHEEIAHTAYSNFYLLVDAPASQPWPASCHGEAAHDVGWLLARMLREASARERPGADPSPAPDAIPSTGTAGDLVPALLRVLDLTLRRAEPPEHHSTARTVVRAVEQLYEETYSGPVSVATTARQVGVSSSSLRQHFAAERGLSPQQSLLEVRLRHALTLLRSSDLPLAAVAERCGFHSASHLSRRVKEATGSPPGALRSSAPA
jgi:AraC-like DNA-binding protein